MGHVYHKNPELGQPDVAPKARKSLQIRRDLSIPADSELRIHEKHDPKRGTSLRPDSNDAGVMDATDDNENPIVIPALSRIDDVSVMDIHDEAEVMRADRKLADHPLQERLAAAVEAEYRDSQTWYTRMARGAKDVATAAGGLWKAISRKGQDPAFKPESILFHGTADWIDNVRSMAVGKKHFKKELEPGVWTSNDEPSLLHILANGFSAYELGHHLKTGYAQIGWGVTADIQDRLTRNQEKATKEAVDDFSATPNLADVYMEAKNTLQEIFGGAAEAIVEIPKEVWDRRAELSNLTKYVLGGGFAAEIYSGVRDQLTGKQRKEAENILKDTRSAANGDIVSIAAEPELRLRAGKPGKTKATTGEDPNSAREAPTSSALSEGLHELGGEIDKATKQIKEFTVSMPTALLEVAKFGAEGVVDLGRGYGTMFTWMGQQFKAAAEAYQALEDRLSQIPHGQEHAKLKRETLQVAAGRMDVAAQESHAIAAEAVTAKNTLVNNIVRIQEDFQRTIDEAEKKIAVKARQIARDKVGGTGVAMLRAEKASLERQRDQYRSVVAALAALDNVRPEAGHTLDAIA